jgi:hypothetical protein
MSKNVVILTIHHHYKPSECIYIYMSKYTYIHTHSPLLSAMKKALTFFKVKLMMQDSKYFTTSTLLVVCASMTAGTPC